MPGKVTEEIINQVREATDIVDLISNYLTLKRSGKGYIGLCPFHSDTSPSFHVNPETQLYYCFGCQKGGNVFNFLMEMEKMSFKEALEFLAEKAGIPLPRSKNDYAFEKEKEALYFVNRWAANFFYKNLFSPQGKSALTYLSRRGISSEMIKTFGLGYSLPGWDTLIKQAEKDAVSVDMLLKAGLIIRKPNGGSYDRFRGRFMIPIVNLYKKVLGFGARLIQDDPNQPKYLNSPETPIFQKGNILFGLYQSRLTIQKKDQAIFVEGYTDLITLFQAGIKNVVATAGTALTPYQARLIRRFTNNVVLLYDADTAGSLAAMRGADIFLDEDMDVKIITLPVGTDPDSYIRDFGAEKFRELLKHANSLIQFKINTLIQRYDRATSQGLTTIINELLRSIVRIKNNIKQNIAVKEIAEYFGLDERAILHQLENIKHTGRIQSNTVQTKDELKKSNIPTKTKYDLAEEDLLRLVLEDTNWLPKIFQYLKLDDIRNKDYNQLFSIILKIYKQNNHINRSHILESITDPELSSKIASVLSENLDVSTDRIKLFEDCLVLLKKRKFEIKLHNLAQEIKLAQQKEIDTSPYIQKYNQCRNEIKQIESKAFLHDSN